MKIGFYTLGCKVNQYETQAMEQILHERGIETGSLKEPCDAYIINTCSVTAVADKKNRAVIRRVRRDNPQAILAVCGCYTQHAADKLENMGIDVVGGSGHLGRVLPPQIQRDMCYCGTFITADSEYPDECFNLLQLISTEAGSMACRYGEEGVDWEWSTDYATGEPAVGVLNSSAFGGQTKSTWNKTCAILTKYGPSGKYHTAIASAPEDMTWNEHRNQRNNSHAMGYVAMAEQNNPAEVIDWTLVYNEEENERLGNLQTDIMTYVREYRAKFASGELDPHSDADWNTYVQTLNGMGTDIWLSCAQSAYDRFMAG